MGGSPERCPSAYAVADPLRACRWSMPVLLVHGMHDETVSIELSRQLRAARRAAAGGDVELVEIEGEAGRAPRAHRPARRGLGAGRALAGTAALLEPDGAARGAQELYERASSTSRRTP